jgi:hypothetical protein
MIDRDQPIQQAFEQTGSSSRYSYRRPSPFLHAVALTVQASGTRTRSTDTTRCFHQSVSFVELF